MHPEEIRDIQRKLRARRLMGRLISRVQQFRETNVTTSVYNAFNYPSVNTDFMELIRREGKRLIAETESVAA